MKEQGWIVAATLGEAAAILAQLTDRRRQRLATLHWYNGSYQGVPVKLVITGMGQQRAAQIEKLLQIETPAWVCIIGISGGLSVDLKANDLYWCDWVVDAQSDRRVADRQMLMTMQQRSQLPLLGEVCTPKIVATVAEKQRVAASSGASAVDLETYTYAAILQRYKIPWVALRAVSDTHDESLPLLLQKFIETQDSLVKQFFVICQLLINDGLKPLLILRRRLVSSATSLEAHLRDLIHLFLLDKNHTNH